MAKTQSTKLAVATRQPAHSREIRRLRRAGRVPGVLYGRGQDPVSFDVDARELRHALAASGAVLDLQLDDSGSESAVLKDAQRHPVRGDVLHIDLLRVDLNQTIQAVVTVELTGSEDAPGVKEGGVLTHETRELNVEALPADIPDVLQVDVSGMEVAATLTLGEITAPQGVTLLDDPEATIIASITAPTAVEEPGDEVETETEVVGEGAGEAEGSAEDADAGDVPADAGDTGGE
ncbi:50S ribosomal protein L25 [Conexibacter sp. SYSU D00693]|uniref:50S ribosomal protein L25 n=1 Tax=Conexibacter sp. SYSU D00693 TaxID=2812560 RepID=UPI00196B5CD2|nr:50S ribosomal protein L25 [Conexibacter sp. SYSU D00693]